MEYRAGSVQPIGSIEQGWSLIKNDYWLFFGMAVVMLVIVMGVSFVLNFIAGLFAGIISAAIGIASQNAGDIGKASSAILPQLIGQVVGLFTGLITNTLAGMLTCGIFTALSRKANGGVPEFGDLFSGFQYFQPCFLFSLIVTLVYFVLNVIALVTVGAVGLSTIGANIITKDGKLNPELMGALMGVGLIVGLIYLIIALIISIGTAFVYPLIVVRKVSLMEAFALSFKAGMSNFFGIFGLLFVQGLMAIGGALLCLVGVLFVIPILSAGIFSAYLQVFGNSPDMTNQMPPPPPIFNNPQRF